MAAPVSIAARLNRLPITPTHRAVVALAGIGTFFDLFDIFLAGVLGTVLTEQFHLSRVALPAVLGSGFLGMFVGAAALGAVADRVGRRRAFLFTLACYSIFTLAGAFAPNASILIVTRFLAGIGIGAEPPVIDAYLGEFLPARVRGRYTALAYTFGFISVPASGFLARVLVPTAPLGVAGWRWMFVAGAAGGAIAWVLRRRLPESPRWLESVGRVDEAEAIARRLEAEAAARAPESSRQLPAASFQLGAGRSDTARVEEHPATGQPGLHALTSRQFRQRTAVLCVFHAFQTWGYYGFGTLVPLVLASKGFSIVHSLTFTAIVFLGYPLGSAVSVPIVDRVDRRWLISASALLMALSGLALGTSTSGAAILLWGFAYTVVSNVFSNAFHIFQAEIFPTYARATAAGAAYGISRISSALMPFLLVPILQRHGATAMFTAVAGAMLIVVLDIAIFAPSTTGRPLEEIA